jgi:hypothetical protein
MATFPRYMSDFTSSTRVYRNEGLYPYCREGRRKSAVPLTFTLGIPQNEASYTFANRRNY